jgi:hypothetical protein
MSDRKPKVIKKDQIDAQKEYQTRHEKSLLKILAVKYPADAIRFVMESNEKIKLIEISLAN